MASFIKNRAVVEDSWRHLDDASSAPDGQFTVSLSRWLAERETLRGLKHVGIRVAANEDLEVILEDLDYLQVIALDFPKFADGRNYSKARLLRERYGFDGELRATGDILRDQLFYLERCGFNAFELAEGDAERALLGFQDFSVTYQTAADGTLPVYLRAKSEHAAAV